jgi:hypothetical protein
MDQPAWRGPLGEYRPLNRQDTPTAERLQVTSQELDQGQTFFWESAGCGQSRPAERIPNRTLANVPFPPIASGSG